MTILVGENGSGKSTLIEAIAVAAGFNAEGGTGNFNFRTQEHVPALPATYGQLFDVADSRQGKRVIVATYQGGGHFDLAYIAPHNFTRHTASMRGRLLASKRYKAFISEGRDDRLSASPITPFVVDSEATIESA